MHKLWRMLISHAKADFHAGQYSAIALFLIITIVLNYWFDFEDNVLETQTGITKFLCYLLFYSVAYYGTLLITTATKYQTSFWQNSGFWIKSIFALMVLSLDSSLPYLWDLIGQMFNPALQYWMYKVSANLISFFTVMIPLLLFYFVRREANGDLYGLAPKKFDSRPYFILLLILLPLLVCASFTQSFMVQYPMYKTSSAHIFLKLPEWITVAGYELAYGLDFITVEFLFRGFMVIGMMSVLGRSSILAMAVTYCFLHFTKPPGEAISSIFGGYMLGVIAYETKSIWGGVILHVGIAWLMEVAAFVQKTFGQLS